MGVDYFPFSGCGDLYTSDLFTEKMNVVLGDCFLVFIYVVPLLVSEKYRKCKCLNLST